MYFQLSIQQFWTTEYWPFITLPKCNMQCMLISCSPKTTPLYNDLPNYTLTESLINLLPLYFANSSTCVSYFHNHTCYANLITLMVGTIFGGRRNFVQSLHGAPSRVLRLAVRGRIDFARIDFITDLSLL